MARSSPDSFWFRFYPDKYAGGTVGFSLEMHGAYLLMLLHQHANGPFKEQVAVNMVGDVWTRIRHKFNIDEDGNCSNFRMEEESAHKRKIATIRSEAGKKGGNSSAIGKQLVSNCSANAPRLLKLTDSNSDSISLSSSDMRSAEEKRSEALVGFEAFWKAYPKRQNRVEAENWWINNRPTPETQSAIIAALKWQVRQESWTKDGGQFIPAPAKYLEGKRWTDERVGVAAAMSQKPVSTYTPPDPDEELCGDEEYTALGAIFKGVVKSV